MEFKISNRLRGSGWKKGQEIHSEWQRQFEEEESFGVAGCLFFEVRRFDDV